MDIIGAGPKLPVEQASSSLPSSDAPSGPASDPSAIRVVVGLSGNIGRAMDSAAESSPESWEQVASNPLAGLPVGEADFELPADQKSERKLERKLEYRSDQNVGDSKGSGFAHPSEVSPLIFKPQAPSADAAAVRAINRPQGGHARRPAMSEPVDDFPTVLALPKVGIFTRLMKRLENKPVTLDDVLQPGALGNAFKRFSESEFSEENQSFLFRMSTLPDVLDARAVKEVLKTLGEPLNGKVNIPSKCVREIEALLAVDPRIENPTAFSQPFETAHREVREMLLLGTFQRFVTQLENGNIKV